MLNIIFILYRSCRNNLLKHIASVVIYNRNLSHTSRRRSKSTVALERFQGVILGCYTMELKLLIQH